jgi:aminodeoxyfutalosine deaminase
VLSAIQDQELLDELKGRKIGIELNPSSNLRTGVCSSFAAHPLRRYFDAGLLVTLNSDDPAFFASDLANEYLLAHSEQGFSWDELRELAANSFRASFLPDVTQRSWIERVKVAQ